MLLNSDASVVSRRTAIHGLVVAGLASLSGSTQPISAASADVAGVKDEAWASYRCTPDQRGIAQTTLPAKPELKWELASPDGWVAACAIVEDRVFAPALAGYLHCLDLKTGQEIWKYRSIDNPDPKKFAPGFKAAPLVTADTVYLGDEDGVLHALNRSSGEVRWKFATGAEIAGCVSMYQDKLLLASHDSFLYCLTLGGEEVWKFLTQDRINCSPGVAEHFTFLAGCDEHLRVLDLRDGTEVRDVPMQSFLIASPALVDDLLYVGTHSGEVAAVNWKTGETAWRYRCEREMPVHASAAVTDDLVIVGGHDKLLHAIDRSTGESKWRFATKGRIECSAAVVDDRVFFGSGDGNLYGVNLKTGMEAWKFNAGHPINAGIAVGEKSLVVGEDDSNGKLRCFR
ncbi:MAG: PQQ-binding-like beta-propeller repeat protein [Planctomycetaceae bacterium]|nr:PQQ-binding-like beta-propeller repeat protein [Planctomycetaceae bacterium]